MNDFDYRLRLRKKAMDLLSKESEKLNDLDKETVKHLFHELQVHQIELEIQNEELRNIQHTMEANRARYTSLFDSAPVGYVILDRAGIIKQFNNAFYDIIKHNGMMKKYVAFADLLTEDAAHTFRSRFASFLKNPTGKSMEATICDEGNNVKTVLLELSSHLISDSELNQLPDELLVTITDVTKIKKIKTQLQSALERVKELSGLIPICSVCRKIRDDKGFWESIEKFIETHSGTGFTHGICPKCSDQLYGHNKWYQKMKNEKKTD